MKSKATQDIAAFRGKPIAFQNEHAARVYAKKNLSKTRLAIIRSVHIANQEGDYFIDRPDGFIRSWEHEVYCGIGGEA